jgi:hypothetical protein
MRVYGKRKFSWCGDRGDNLYDLYFMESPSIALTRSNIASDSECFDYRVDGFCIQSLKRKKNLSPSGMKGVSSGPVHKLPADLRKAITSTPAARAVWEDITPLARNEWICWVTSGKKTETRDIRINKALSKLKGGMRRPCCWAGCPHR